MEAPTLKIHQNLKPAYPLTYVQKRGEFRQAANSEESSNGKVCAISQWPRLQRVVHYDGQAKINSWQGSDLLNYKLPDFGACFMLVSFPLYAQELCS